MIEHLRLKYPGRVTPRWLAGFVDGDGCISIRPSGQSFSCYVTIAQKHLSIIELIAIKYPGGCVRQVGSKLGKSWQVSWHGRTCKPILLDIKDYLVIKAEQAELALEFIETLGNKHAFLSDEKLAKRESIGMRIVDLNEKRLIPIDPLEETRHILGLTSEEFERLKKVI